MRFDLTGGAALRRGGRAVWVGRRWWPELAAAANPVKIPVSTAVATPRRLVNERNRCRPAFRECIRERRSRAEVTSALQLHHMKLR